MKEKTLVTINIFKLPLLQKYKILANLVLIVIGSAFIALSSQIHIYLPFSPIPITLQVFSVILIALAYGFKRGIAAIMVFLFSGIAGLPVFAGYQHGFARLMGPTGGYLVGFILAGALIGFFSDKGYLRKFLPTLIFSLIGLLIIYFVGTVRLAYFTGFKKAIHLGVLPFVLADCVKILIASLIISRFWMSRYASLIKESLEIIKK